jgi:hypothetical protein
LYRPDVSVHIFGDRFPGIQQVSRTGRQADHIAPPVSDKTVPDGACEGKRIVTYLAACRRLFFFDADE